MYTYNTGRILARPEKEHGQYLAILEQIPLAMKGFYYMARRKLSCRNKADDLSSAWAAKNPSFPLE